MALEQAGGLFDADKLKAKLQKSFLIITLMYLHHLIPNASRHSTAKTTRYATQIQKVIYFVA